VQEACYCGRVGQIEDRKPASDDGRDALKRPRCVYLDHLSWLRGPARKTERKEAYMTKPNAKNAALAALTAVALALVLAGCGAGTSGEDPADEAAWAGAPKQGSSPHTGDYAGKVEGTEVFVAVVVDKEDRALAYLYDGRTDRLPRGPSGSPGPWQTTAPSTSRAREKCASRRRSA